MPRSISKASSPGTLWELRVSIPPALAEALYDLLVAFGSTQWRIEEQRSPRKSACVAGTFPSEVAAAQAWDALKPTLPAAVSRRHPKGRAIPPENWVDSYKRHFTPWHKGRIHWVPVWERERYKLPRGHRAVWLDPGMAFGTGKHETTRLCLDRLVDLSSGEPRSLIDAGCGSGILAISAAQLGFVPVRGFDLDATAVAVSQSNAVLNGLDPSILWSCAGLADGLAGERAHVVVCNILADVLLGHRNSLLGAVAPGGSLVLSGMLRGEADAVRRAFLASAPGWSCDSRRLGDWADLRLDRPH